MADDHLGISRQIQRIGRSTREWIVSAQACPKVGLGDLSAIGITETGADYRFERPSPTHGVLLACLGGGGRVLIDGGFVAMGPGSIYVAPQGVPHAYHARPGSPWRFCWATFAGSFVEAPAPLLAEGDPLPLERAMLGLKAEMSTAADAAMIDCYAQLVHAHAHRLVLRWRADDRLWRLWQLVDGDLGRHWTLTGLCREAGTSAESLRLLCRQRTGRTPMRQVAWLRMQRARSLLLGFDLKVNEVAAMLGYDDPFAFSSAFKRSIGASPIAYRRQRRARPVR